jgi:primosomal protein N' (replication factor Y)
LRFNIPVFAEVVVNVPSLTSTYSYSIPDDLRGRLTAGHLVTVPFGGRRAQGLVVGLAEAAPVSEVKAIEGLVDLEPVLTRAQLDLAYWIAHTYLAPLIDCLTLMLPPGLSKRADTLYSLLDSESDGTTSSQQTLLRLLKSRGPLRGRQFDRALPRAHWRSAADALARQGVLARQSVLDPPSVHPKRVRTARLAATLAQVEAVKPRLSKSPTKAARLAAVLDFLANEFDPVDVSWVYAETGANVQDLKDLAEMELIDLGEAEVWRDSLAAQEFVPIEPPTLTADQQKVWEAIRQRITRRQQIENESSVQSVSSVDPPILLHGVTGSGKTEIYLRALSETLARRRRAIVLVPEIALTPQTVRRFASRFPGRVAVWHSQLGEGERYDTWRRARAGLVDVVIGPRSALFAPLPDLGLIVLDEEHDEAYKQDPPRAVPYHAREAAVEYARRAGAACLLGSATPDIVSYQRAKRGEYVLLELPQRIMGHVRRLHELADKYHVEPHYHPVADGPSDAQTIDLPPVEVVDMRQELRMGNTSIFSRRLREALEHVLQRGEQAILFLNRRGTSTYVFCRDCGEALKCSRCEMPFTYHAPKGGQPSAPTLVCHHCNNRRAQPEKCPHCGSARIRYFGAGTEKLEEAVRAEFPTARTLRWDHDVTRTKGAHELILTQFTNQIADVLIGTQMIAKGLDLPLVTLVGVIAADVGLGLPDFRAAERTFQVLTQVAGRAGRGLLGGRVVLQTYTPDHYAIQAAAKHDYADFFAREMRYRKDLGYPPFRRLMRMVYRHPDSERAEAEANVVARQLLARIKDEKVTATDLAGPAPCFFGKIAGEYRWQIVVRGPDPAALARGKMFKGWYIDVDPMSTL